MGHIRFFLEHDPSPMSLHGDPESDAIIAGIKKLVELNQATAPR